MGIERQKPVLLYDGLCGFCDRAVRFVLRFDPQGVIHFAPLQGKFAASVSSASEGAVTDKYL